MTKVKDRINIIDAQQDESLKEEFFRQNIGLIYKVANGALQNVSMDFDEKVSLGHFGLVKAFNTYDSNSGYAFSTYAIRCITNEILMEERRAETRYRKNALSLDGKFTEDKEGNELLLGDIISCEEEEFDSFDLQEISQVYKKFVEVYSERDPKLLKVFNMLIQGEKIADIGKAVGHTQSHTSRLASKAVKAIQEIAIDMEVIYDYSKFSRRRKSEDIEKDNSRENTFKQRVLYVILNYPELTNKEIAIILNWDANRVALLKISYDNGTFTLPPDDKLKFKAEEYLENKMLIGGIV